MELDPIKLVKCKDCGVDVVVNASYPITEVECRDWYCPTVNKTKDNVPFKTETDKA